MGRNQKESMQKSCTNQCYIFLPLCILADRSRLWKIPWLMTICCKKFAYEYKLSEMPPTQISWKSSSIWQSPFTVMVRRFWMHGPKVAPHIQIRIFICIYLYFSISCTVFRSYCMIHMWLSRRHYRLQIVAECRAENNRTGRKQTHTMSVLLLLLLLL